MQNFQIGADLSGIISPELALEGQVGAVRGLELADLTNHEVRRLGDGPVGCRLLAGPRTRKLFLLPPIRRRRQVAAEVRFDAPRREFVVTVYDAAFLAVGPLEVLATGLRNMGYRAAFVRSAAPLQLERIRWYEYIY